MPLSIVSILQKETLLALSHVSIACRRPFDRKELID
jgi:hypothetical protein